MAGAPTIRSPRFWSLSLTIYLLRITTIVSSTFKVDYLGLVNYLIRSFYLDKTFRVVAVGIGDDVDADALNLMASLPSSENTHQITSFDNLPDIAQEVAYDVCQV